MERSLPCLLQDYELKNIFSADETALFHSQLSSKTFRMKGEP
jgi:hypothetical protein